MTGPLRVGVVGVGYLGRFHALIYGRMPGVQLLGVVDRDPERARSVAAEAGCPAYETWDPLLDRVDAVSLVVPTSLHLEVARPFLERGIPTLLEKPIAATREQGREIVALAEAGGTLLQIGHLERFNAGVMALAGHIRRPRFIEAQRLGVFVERATDVDVVSDLMIHDIDIILSLVAAPIARIDAVGTPVLTDHIDIANARLEFEDGSVANVVASRVSTKRLRQMRVFSAEGYLSLDFNSGEIERAYTRPGRDGARGEIVRECIQTPGVKPLDAELAAFVEAVRNGGRPLVDGRTGLKALEVALEVKARIGE